MDKDEPISEEEIRDAGAEVEALEEKGRREDQEERSSTWAELSWGDILDGDLSPERPSLLKRTDGEALLYPGKTHSFIGEPESGKTWAAIAAVAEIVLGGGHAFYIDYEDSQKGLARRLVQLGVSRTAIRKLVHYFSPSKELRKDGPSMRALVRAGSSHKPSLIVLDAVTECMSIQGLDPNSGRDVAEFLNLMPRLWEQTGAAVVLIDHVTKARDQRGRYAIGSQHKLAGVNGASYTFSVESPPSPGRSGTVKVLIGKDREGGARSVAAQGGKVAGRMQFSPVPERGEGALDITIEPQSIPAEWERQDTEPEEYRESDLEERIVSHLRENPGISKKRLRKGLGVQNERLVKAVDRMVRERRLTQDGWHLSVPDSLD